MKTNLIIKINFLVLGLALTLFAIYRLNTAGIDPKIAAALGLNSDTKADGGERILWCDTRVAALIKPNEYRIAQDKNKWLVEHETKKELNFLSVERWFGANCEVKAETLMQSNTEAQSAAVGTDLAPVLLIKFVNGKVEALRRTASGLYLWRDKSFRSSEMDKAIEDLGHLAQTGSSVAE